MPNSASDKLFRSQPQELTTIASLVIAGLLSGFAVISYIPGTLGVESRVVTIPFRGLMLILEFIAFYRFAKHRSLHVRRYVTAALAFSFWTAYCIRFFVDVAVRQVPLDISAGEMALDIFALSIPTFILLYRIKDIGLYRRALPWCMVTLTICCFYSMLRTGFSSQGFLHGRFSGNEILNPILYGHMGLTAMIMGLFICLQIGPAVWPVSLRLVGACGACLGAFTILASATRSAAIAAALLIPVILLLGLRRGSRLLTIGMCILIVVVLSSTLTYLLGNGVQVALRVASSGAYSSADESVSEREFRMGDAWNEFLEHPLLGNAIVEKKTGSYPHNPVVEAYMALGLFGGTVFVLLLSIAVFRAAALVVRYPAMAWVPLCFCQQFVLAMVSGNLYQDPLFWGITAIMLGADLPRAKQKSNWRRGVTDGSQFVPGQALPPVTVRPEIGA